MEIPGFGFGFCFDCTVIFIEFPQKGLEESSIPGGYIRRLKFMLMHFLKENVFEPCLQRAVKEHIKTHRPCFA